MGKNVMGEDEVAAQLSRLDALLRQEGDREAKVLQERSARQKRLNEMQRALLKLFQARSRAVGVKTFRPIVETSQGALADLSKSVKALFDPVEMASFWKQVGYVQLSLASSAAPSLRPYLGHIVGLLLEASERCVVLIFPSLEVASGSLEPLQGQVARIEARGPEDLRSQEAAINRALVDGLGLIIKNVEEERR
ncbi:hypothetical protein AMJ85_03415 [candidate division BRC1 bacterium SM23_51]|nr:MAG: hypothetical protein AMJ85_03415 [candidate division BRC1 bacterium SM23_51]